MAIKSHCFNYSKGEMHYRGGTYPCRRVTCHPKGSPELPRRTFVADDQLDTILYEDRKSKNKEVQEVSEKLDAEIGFYLPADCFGYDNEKILEVLNQKHQSWVFTAAG